MLQIQIPLTITEDFIEDVMETALSVGSTYWVSKIDSLTPKADSDSFSKYLSKGGVIVLTDGETNNEYIISRYTFLQGYQLYVDNCIKNGFNFYIKACDIDGGLADEILQYALFQDVIYG